MNKKVENEKLLVNELFVSIQGEGPEAGTPTFFLRLIGCNLYCCWKGLMGVSLCDSLYASHPEDAEKEIKYRTVQEVFDALMKLREQNPNVRNLVITGGEPLIQRKGLERLFEMIGNSLKISFETNGTLEPMIDQFSSHKITYIVSPKLKSSSCFEGSGVPLKIQEAHERNRINIENLTKFVYLAKNGTLANAYFKFVVSNEEDIEEIKSIYNRIIDHIKKILRDDDWNISDVLNKMFILMPCGETEEKLQKCREFCVNQCIQNGWRYSDRLHITIWGTKRGV